MPSASKRKCRRRRSAFALITSVLLLALVLSVAMQLVTTTSVEAVVASRQHRAVAHKLAVDSAIVLLADSLTRHDEDGRRIVDALDQDGIAAATFAVGHAIVHCRIADDGAKYDPAIFQKPEDQRKLIRSLEMLRANSQLPGVTVSPAPVLTQSDQTDLRSFYWFDQLFNDVKPGAFFALEATQESAKALPVWSDAVTFWGEGRVDLRRVTIPVLETVLSDLRPGLAHKILAKRPSDRRKDFTQAALAAVDAEVRAAAGARLAFDVHRYALELTTRIEDDTRRWYVVATMTKSETTLHHRSQITW